MWWHSGWYGNQDGGTFPFEITISDPTIVILSIKSNLASFEVTVDGIAYTVSSSGIEISTTRGFHRVEVESPIFLDDDTRLVFDRWSDGVSSSQREIYLAVKMDLVAVYLTEFFLKVQSSVSETVGSGWYPAGANATFAALDPGMTGRPSVDSEVRYKFSRWSGDSDSTSPVSWVMMDRPKAVVANWSEQAAQVTNCQLQLLIVSLALLSCSAMLAAICAALRRKARTRMQYAIPTRKSAAGGILVLLVFLTAVTHSQMVQPTNALTLLQPESIEIGRAVWYRWNQAASDTLLLWLGGGTVEQTGFLLNQYEFESYNTMLFVQDLARYYDVLALKTGSVRSVDPALNRTIIREPYPSSDNFIERIRIWAGEQGYTYLYVVGYSVGAMIAANELTLANPAKYTSPNGLIIITTKFPEPVYSKVGSLQASLLLLYGDRIKPEYTTSGERFFQSAPEEGWRNGFWYHKEYHVIPGVEHEVWTITDSGEYDSRALLLTVGFIEKSKALQFEQLSESISHTRLDLATSTQPLSPFQLEIVSTNSPSKVRTRDAFRVAATVRYDLPSNFTVAVVAFDAASASILSAAERQLLGRGEAQFITTLLSGDSAGTWSLSLIPLVATRESWSVVAVGMRNVLIDVTNSFAITAIVGYPNVPVMFDNETVLTGPAGELTVNATPGEHLISVPPIVMLTNTSRAVFEQWNNSQASPTLRLNTSSEMMLLAIYRRQHYLTVTSPFGQAKGTGWYDENAIAPFHVAPPLLIEQTVHVFTGWSGDSIDSSPASNVFMNSSKNIQASWKNLERGEQNENLLALQTLFALSLAALLVSLIFAVMSLRSRREPMP